jgi:hypothetical protein
MHQAENKRKNEILFRLITMSRQIGIDIYIIIQAATSLDVFIRNIAEATIHLRNLSKVPNWGWLFVKLLGDFQRVYLSPQTKKIISKSYKRFDPYIGTLYKTTGVGDKINLRRSDGRVGKSKGNLSLGIVLALIAIFAAISWGAWRAYRLLNPAKGELSELDPLRLAGGMTKAPGTNFPGASGYVDKDKPKPLTILTRRLDNSFIALSNGDVFSTTGHGVRMRGAIDNGDTLVIHLLNGSTVTVNLH